MVVATWVRRLGRAVALSVIVFFLIGLFWPMVVEITFSLILRPWMQGQLISQWYNNFRWLMNTLTSLSPIYGTLTILQQLQWNQFGARMWGGLAVVIGVKAGAAGLLLGFTIRTFDHCLGRVPESPRDRRREELVVLEEIP